MMNTSLFHVIQRPFLLRNLFWAGLCSLMLAACSSVEKPKQARDIAEQPAIFPDYRDVTLPPKVAPLRFQLTDPVSAALTVLSVEGKEWLTAANDRGQFLFDEDDWQEMLQTAVGRSVEVKVYVRKKASDEWLRYRSFHWQVTADPVDAYLAYRLIEPGYELWNKMGIYQRELASFDQEVILENSLTEHNCMNCHTFCQQRPDRMLFHMRATLPGTYVLRDGEIEKLNTKASGKVNTLVYPSWHSSGRYIAFSVNNTRQAFHKRDANRVEVYDLASDVVVYDVERHEVVTDSLLYSDTAFETFPTFAPDGRTLYFCSAQARTMPGEFDQVKYSLCRTTFDLDTRRFGSQVDTLFNSRTTQRSASFPRVSPDGRWLVFTVASYGNFSIWHRDADLYLADLQQGTVRPLVEANSDEVESYHSWSSNSRWLVFSSRRMDGLYTRPYLMHLDAEGRGGKPFVLPQADPDTYTTFPLSYNLPEWIRDWVKVNPHDWAEKARDEGTPIRLVEP